MTIGEKIQEEAWYAREEGLAEGLEKARAEARAAYIAKLMQKLNLTREEAEKILS